MSDTPSEAAPGSARPPREAVAAIRIHAPSRRNRKLAGLLAAANASTQLKARWHAAQVTAERLGMSDHSWVHLQIVLNSALRLYRLPAGPALTEGWAWYADPSIGAGLARQ